MGRIYEALRKLEQRENQPYEDDELEYVQFSEFIDILELHSDDNMDMIAQYLLTHDEFLKLDYYFYDLVVSREGGFEDFEKDYQSANDQQKPKILSEYSESIFYRKKYDEVHNELGMEYPTELFLEEIQYDQLEEKDFASLYWKVEDLINLDCLKLIELDREAFNECREALYTDPHEVLEYKKENKELLKQVQLFESIEAGELKTELIQARSTIKDQEDKIKALLSKIDELKEDFISKNDEKLHPRTANNASKIIGALASELLNIDLTKPYAESSNGIIQKAIEIQGNSLSKEVIADWLILAHENTI